MTVRGISKYIPSDITNKTRPDQQVTNQNSGESKNSPVGRLYQSAPLYILPKYAVSPKIEHKIDKNEL
jgi:hypothetical protein